MRASVKGVPKTSREFPVLARAVVNSASSLALRWNKPAVVALVDRLATSVFCTNKAISSTVPD